LFYLLPENYWKNRVEQLKTRNVILEEYRPERDPLVWLALCNNEEIRIDKLGKTILPEIVLPKDYPKKSPVTLIGIK
jgi:hypothetical protein